MDFDQFLDELVAYNQSLPEQDKLYILVDDSTTPNNAIRSRNAAGLCCPITMMAIAKGLDVNTGVGNYTVVGRLLGFSDELSTDIATAADYDEHPEPVIAAMRNRMLSRLGL